MLFLSLSLSTSAVQLKDVSKDHWAYDSVKKLIEKGYLSLYEDGTFSGSNKVTRYEIAVLVARILENMDSGDVKGEPEDVETLRKLSIEFQEELVDLAQKQEVFTNKINTVKKNNLIQNEDIARTNEKINSVEEELAKIIDSIIKIKNIEEEISRLNIEIEELENNLNNTDDRVAERKEEIKQLKKIINNQSNDEKLNDISDRLSVTQTQVYSLQSKVKDLEEKINLYQDELKTENKEEGITPIYLIGAVLLALLL